MSRVVAVIGPTGIGKSRLAVQIARVFDGEVVNGDSRQVYRYMDIGTAKPAAEEQALAPHHLIDIADPDEPFSLAQYQELAWQTIEEINCRHKLPVLAGGTGQYIWAVLEGWDIPAVPPDAGLRETLEKQAGAGKALQLYREIMDADPETAAGIDPQNVRRLVRAVEIVRKTGGKIRKTRKITPSFQRLIIGLTADREELYRRVDARVEEMIKGGLVGEVEKLLQMGYDFTLPALSGIGYREIGAYLRGETAFSEAVRKIKHRTHRFIRQQYNWFKLADNRIHWFDVSETPEPAIFEIVHEFLDNEANEEKS